MNLSTKIRRAWHAQATILSFLGAPLEAKGFYLPCRYAADIKAPGADDDIPWLRRLFDENVERFDAMLDYVRPYQERLRQFDAADPENRQRPRFDQDWFSGLDAAVAYGLVRHIGPRRILEIGSGHSTRFMVQAILDGELDTHFHSVDPEPRKDIDTLCSEVTRKTVQQLDIAEFTRLQQGDILFVDGSHIAMPGSDVDYLFGHILPTLAHGVVVHIHDIALPGGYPARWPFNSYNEQNVLAAMLGGGDRYQALIPCAYLRRNQPQLLDDIHAPNPAGAHEGSFWLWINQPDNNGDA